MAVAEARQAVANVLDVASSKNFSRQGQRLKTTKATERSRSTTPRRVVVAPIIQKFLKSGTGLNKKEMTFNNKQDLRD